MMDRENYQVSENDHSRARQAPGEPQKCERCDGLGHRMGDGCPYCGGSGRALTEDQLIPIGGGRESVDDAMAVVESFGLGIDGLNDTFARQVLLAAEIKRLRSQDGQTLAGPAQMHPDDAAVDRFAVAMKSKLKLKREQGRGGWQTCPKHELWIMLDNHVHKRNADSVDVGNFAMMIHQRDVKSAATPVREQTAQPDERQELSEATDDVFLQALHGTLPLFEPVYIENALRAGRQAEVVLNGGTGPLACVMLVNIQLTPWIHTEDTAKAFADGYNKALKQLRAALVDVVKDRGQA